ncbi:DMT family transporter [Desulfovibrio litoralis]|uniref:Threonine/homoserine efflux transporter RhtA n=1 Tax=Desulfovibrio litoralis DSM 11393 TaxID=1121455 RepID=A0A1M7RVZ5_9BACT|nr:DMT family transporter [Desulfovibrio litoralis]SHN50172.1 Threonine/homoserine efflux transporter RhtA [Desulfovibrio litoralis DSM 11393]
MSGLRRFEGVLMALCAVIIWSGNFIIAKQQISDISPSALSLLRWTTACIFLAPFGLKPMIKDWHIIRQHLGFHLLVAFWGISLFNTLIYYAAHYTSSINMVIIASTAPMITMLLGSIFLKEPLNSGKIFGALLAFIGIIVIASKGSLGALMDLEFSIGDIFSLTAAVLFAVYSILVRFVPKGISQLGFLNTIFIIGVLCLIPMTLIELYFGGMIHINSLQAVGTIIYIGLGTSVICFFLWNAAINKIGSFQASLVYYTIPIFGCLWAVLFLNEHLTFVHLIGGILVLSGVCIATIAARR